MPKWRAASRWPNLFRRRLRIVEFVQPRASADHLIARQRSVVGAFGVTLMSCCKLLPVAALAALAAMPAPALAKADGSLSRELRDPYKAEAMGDMLGAMLGVMLDMKAEPLARVMEAAGEPEAARKIPRGATIGDLAGPNARRMPQEVRRRAPAMIGALGEFAGMLEEMAPQFEQIAKDFDRKVENAD